MAPVAFDVISGIDEDDQSGYSVSSAGDVNGDGIDDLFIGARLADPYGSNTGETYVVFGQDVENGQTFALNESNEFDIADLTNDNADGSAGFVINGIDAGDESGWAISSAGDVNGDGIDDLVIGARRAAPMAT